MDAEFVWGRGAIDDKNCVLSLLGALEAVVSGTGRAPARTIVLAFGHDEEIGGHDVRVPPPLPLLLLLPLIRQRLLLLLLLLLLLFLLLLLLLAPQSRVG